MTIAQNDAQVQTEKAKAEQAYGTTTLNRPVPVEEDK